MRKTRIPQSWFLMTGSIGQVLPEEPIQYRNRLPILIWQIQVFFTTAFPTSFGSITSPKTNFTLLMYTDDINRWVALEHAGACDSRTRLPGSHADGRQNWRSILVMVGECRRGGLLSLFDLRAVSNILGRRALVCTTPHRHCPAWLSNLAHRGD